jgi:hypothetical protein
MIPTASGTKAASFPASRRSFHTSSNLGAGAIWLSSVLMNARFDQGAYRYYDIQDFLHAKPFFADIEPDADQEMRDLVDVAHLAGLYVILDIFSTTLLTYSPTFRTATAMSIYTDHRMDVQWRNAAGVAVSAFTSPAAFPDLGPDEAIWPMELQQNEYFRRQGDAKPHNDDTLGDFPPSKQFYT